MTQYNGLLSSIAQSLSIARGTAEDDISWKCRIVYSVLGNLALASLWDIQDEHEPISVTHFKHRIEQLTKAYFLMYPEVKAHFLPEIEKLYDEIYESYLNTGYIYHSPKRIAPAALTQAKHGNIIFQRGVPLNQRVFMSGLGLYQVSKEQTKSNHSVQSMFLLSENSLIDNWNDVVSNAQWIPFRASNDVEYLRTESPFYWSYWVRDPDRNGTVSMLRIGSYQSQLYYLYKVDEEGIFVSQLPNWMVKNYRYRTLASGCLCASATLPAIQYSIDGKIVYIKLGYLLPPAELNFLKLYSWPASFYNLPSDFSRIMDIKIFLEIKENLERIGYQFIEE